MVVVTKKEVDTMKRELLDNGNIWQKSDGRWIGMVRYKDEFGATQRKSFSSKKKKTLQAKMTGLGRIVLLFTAMNAVA